jgi:hypothetical protein
METDEKRLARLKDTASKRGLDIIRAPEGGRESGRGWRLLQMSDKSHVGRRAGSRPWRNPR